MIVLSCLGRLSAGHPVVYNADRWVPDQGISGATGANVASPALKACGESASTILAGSLFHSLMVLDAKENL